jgi:hypothetical protein
LSWFSDLPFVGATLPQQFFFDALPGEFGDAAAHLGGPPFHLLVSGWLQLNLRPYHAIMLL